MGTEHHSSTTPKQHHHHEQSRSHPEARQPPPGKVPREPRPSTGPHKGHHQCLAQLHPGEPRPVPRWIQACPLPQDRDPSSRPRQGQCQGTQAGRVRLLHQRSPLARHDGGPPEAFAGKTGPKAKVGMIVASNLLVTPVQMSVYLASLGVINGLSSVPAIIKFVRMQITTLLKISWVSNPLSLLFAQRFLSPETWVPFFSSVAFVLGPTSTQRSRR